MSYYFALLALPPLSMKIRPDLSFEELKELLSMNLSPEDRKQWEALRQRIDLYNIRAFWLGQPLDDRGNLNAKNLEEVLLIGDYLPIYFSDYLNRYETVSDRLAHFSELAALFYRDEEGRGKGFLLQYFWFERELMLILAALRAKQTGKDVMRELQFEDPSDPLVAYILAQKDAAEFTPPKEWDALKVLFADNSRNPKKLHRSILEYRFEKIEEMYQEYTPFSTDQILGYAAGFLVAEEWFSLDREQGHLAVESLSQYG